jgi:hypothetical protein
MHQSNEHTSGVGDVARTTDFADQRAMFLDREADAMLFLGRHAAAERLRHLAREMRGVSQ